MSRMGMIALAGAVLVEPPLAAQAAEFCPPPQAPQGFSLPADGRAFHGAPTIERLQIGTNAAIPCRAIRDSPGSLCGSYQLRYAPWDPYPQQAILRISTKEGNGVLSKPMQGPGDSVVLISCLNLPSPASPFGDRALKVRTTRELLVPKAGPLKTLSIRESFLTGYPLVPNQ